MKNHRYLRIGLTGLIFLVTLWWGGKAFALSVSTNSISFTASVPEDGSEQQYEYAISYWGATGGGNGYISSTNRAWIEVSPKEQVSTVDSAGTFKVIVKVSKRFFPEMQGTFTGEVRVCERNGMGEQVITVTLTLLRSSQSFQASPSSIQVKAFAIDEKQYSYTISVTGPGTTFTASSNQPWISVNTVSGAIPGQLTITVTVSAQFFSGPGTYTGKVMVRNNLGNTDEVDVNLVISSFDFTVSPSNITVRVYSLDENPVSYTYDITVSGGSGNTFIAYSNQPWISVPTSGQIPGKITATISVSTQFFTGAGTYNGLITVRDSVGNQATVSVQVIVGRDEGEEALVISPSSVSLTLYMQPGSTQSNVLTFSITGSRSQYTATSDAPWLQIQQGGTGTVPGILTAQIQLSFALFPEEGTYEGHIIVLNSLGNTARATVSIKIIHAIPDKLVVTPNAFTFSITRANLSKITRTVEIKNANYTRNNFRWSAEVVDPWIRISPTSGEGSTNIQIIIDPALLIGGTQYTGTVKFRSNLPTQRPEDAEATLTITVRVSQVNELTAFPSYLFWSVEQAEDGTISDLTPQILHVYAGGYGFSLNYNVSWIEIEFLNPATGENGNSLATIQAEGIFRVTPQASILKSYGIGRHEGVITIVDRGSAFYREVPVIVEIRKPGDPISLPVSQPVFSQMAPGFITVDATDAHSLHMLLHVDDNLAVYSNPEACSAVGGIWLDPFRGQAYSGVTGLPYCSESEKVYVLLTAPQKQPNKVYAYTPMVTERFILVYQNGLRVNDSTDPAFSVGPIPEASFGPMALSGLKGQMFISIRAGRDLNSTREIQEIQVNINTLEGTWIVSENYKGKSYTYGSDRLLKLTPNPDGFSYSGTWGVTPVTASIADGKSSLYKIEFVEKGITYEYVVTSLKASEMKGKWRFSYRGNSSSWESFSAVRTSGNLGLGGLN
ncbi:MAG: hypothetical protein N2260_05275 [Syntrophobacterales bacterium]|nr:hypothetical protein [Syntrophobacterales bacterium]